MVCGHSERVMDFLSQIGLVVMVVPGASGFIDHVAIVAGGLHVSPECPVSGLLHEAGHVGVMPACFRHMLNGDLRESWERVENDPLYASLEPDSQLSRALLQAGETEATAWAWAVGKHLGIPEQLIIEDADYQGAGENLRLQLNINAYLGINGLSHGGFCVIRESPYKRLPVYPELVRWLQQ